jgi:uncharacterized repeat protein (TIGR02543 family)
MRKLFLITAVLIILVTGCPDSDDPEVPTTGATTIVFDNTEGTCAITVYSSYLRGEQNKIVQVPADSISDAIPWQSGESMSFYFSYQINIRGIDEFTIDYVPQGGKDQKQVRVDPNIENTIHLPPLSEAFTSLDTLLSNKSHLFIRNNSSYSLQLLRNTSIPIPPDNVSETVVNSRERPQYTIDPAPVSNYRLLGLSGNPIPFPASLVNFEAGRAYYFIYSNDVLHLESTIELIPGNVHGLSLGKARVLYYWVNDNSMELGTTATAAIIPAGRTVTITPQGTGYVVKQWYLNGINTGQSEDTYVFSNTTIGEHTVDLFVEKDGKIYNTSITITVGTPYTVSFDANGGFGTAPDAMDYELLGSSITLPDGSGLSKPRYAFVGWNTAADGTGDNYSAGSSYTVSGNVTLYAIWNEAHTITFNANDGIGTVPDAQVVAAGSSTTLPDGSGLARTNFIFGGWNINDSGTGDNYGAGSSYTPVTDVTLYAMWFPNNATSLTASNWTNGEITSTASGSAAWYSFNVVSGNTYSVYWNDRERSDDTKTLDVKVSAYYGSGTNIFTGIDDGWSIPQEFTASSGGRVIIKVEPYVSGYLGTFAVRYTSNTPDITITFDANGGSGTVPEAAAASTGSSITLPDQGSLTRTGYTFGGWNTNSSGTGTNYDAGASYTVPSFNTILYARWLSSGSGSEANPISLTVGVWTDGSISGSAAWYSFYAISGTTYYIWWNDSYDGNSTKTLDVKVSGYSPSGTNIFTGIDSGWSSARSITVSSSGTVKIKVEPYTSGYTGTFAVAYSTSNIRPGNSSGGGTGTETNPISLTNGIWADGSITSTASGSAVWYSFSITSGTTYYIWWNDSFEGNGTKTLDVKVSAYYSNGTSILSGQDSGWNGWYFTPYQTGTVKIKVEPYSSGSTGTFAVAYRTSSARP